ncbi:1-acyl-sn-glycerol-3-phosphate acyltransferase 2-like isoform X2 [Camellia sinensis]|uniref:1-acyl-sn-glycerol-3-phosphate acyltransferase 2-like isoform X2 n=1 Tax=Camellia sinensis TaxID=4442 RepID=UPI0010355EE7|nr:1-acyl-sn-glycerol-3-phosphate acyltransferase 2-like isoform X2 [Camellia sinensis]
MAIAAVIVLPLGLIFLLSGILLNFIQAIFFILVRPFSMSMYRRINKVVAELLWLEIIWLFDWWADIKVDLFIDSETFQLMGREHALVIANHRCDIDWLVGWVLAQRAGCLGSALAIMKKSSKYLPVLGWSMWFSDYVFLERSWSKDEETLKSGFQNLKDFPRPFWLALFVEGTRFTQEKLLAAQEYAASAGLPVPRNVLVPRTKGFVSAVNNMRSFVPAIYDVTVAIPKNEPRPTMLRMFRGQSSVLHVHVRRHLMNELPETNSGVAQWCRDMFVSKVMIGWSCLLIYGSIKFFEWFSGLPSWEELAICVSFLAIVMILMQILIVFSQSEHSILPKVSPPREPMKENLLQ